MKNFYTYLIILIIITIVCFVSGFIIPSTVWQNILFSFGVNIFTSIIVIWFFEKWTIDNQKKIQKHQYQKIKRQYSKLRLDSFWHYISLICDSNGNKLNYTDIINSQKQLMQLVKKIKDDYPEGKTRSQWHNLVYMYIEVRNILNSFINYLDSFEDLNEDFKSWLDDITRSDFIRKHCFTFTDAENSISTPDGSFQKNLGLFYTRWINSDRLTGGLKNTFVTPNDLSGTITELLINMVKLQNILYSKKD